MNKWKALTNNYFGLCFGVNHKVGCVFPMVAVPILPHAEFGRNDHREYALHFIKSMSLFFINRSYGMNPENHRNVISVASFYSNRLNSRKPPISSIKYCFAVVDMEICSLENKLICMFIRFRMHFGWHKGVTHCDTQLDVVNLIISICKCEILLEGGSHIEDPLRPLKERNFCYTRYWDFFKPKTRICPE